MAFMFGYCAACGTTFGPGEDAAYEAHLTVDCLAGREPGMQSPSDDAIRAAVLPTSTEQTNTITFTAPEGATGYAIHRTYPAPALTRWPWLLTLAIKLRLPGYR